MISYLKGKVIELNFTHLSILTSGGVGYEVFINELTYNKISIQEDIELFIYHHRTENSQSLFGFVEHNEKQIFTELIKISGIGGKVAMLILGLGINRLIEAISYEDNKTIEGIKGIGKKMAEKIILELKDKDFGITLNKSKKSENDNNINKDLFSSIRDTLVNMGYTGKDIDNILKKLPEGMIDAGEIIPYIIKQLS